MQFVVYLIHAFLYTFVITDREIAQLNVPHLKIKRHHAADLILIRYIAVYYIQIYFLSVPLREDEHGA